MAKKTRDQNHGNVLRRVRESRDLSQAEAAKRSRVSRTMFSSWELRTREMTLTQLDAVRDGLGLSKKEVEDILNWWREHPVRPVESEAGA